MEIIQDLLMSSMFRHEPSLRMAFEKIMAYVLPPVMSCNLVCTQHNYYSHDRSEYFKNPVSRTEVPDYFDIIKHPMCWNMIDAKLDRHEYWDLQAFKVRTLDSRFRYNILIRNCIQDDVNLVFSNAILYNKAGTTFYKAAQRLQTSSQAIFIELEETLRSLGVLQPVPSDDGDANAMDTSTGLQTTIGTLEPSLHILDLLVSEDAIKDSIDLILSSDPLVSLFNFELGKIKPPPPPPPPKPKYTKAQSKREKARRLAKGDGTDMIDVSPGFRAPRTRKGLAAAAAFEAEAHADGGDVEVISPEEHSRKEAAKQKSKGWKRGPTILPGQSAVPPIVDEVDAWRSFKMFDAGWILPENQKRGGRTAVERPPLPPPRKRTKTSS